MDMIYPFLFIIILRKSVYSTWVSRVIPHPSTDQAYGRLSCEFGMGSPACATSMAVYNSFFRKSL